MLLFNILINSFKSSTVVSCVSLLYPGTLGVFRGPAYWSADPLIRSMISPVSHTPLPPRIKILPRWGYSFSTKYCIVVAPFGFVVSSVSSNVARSSVNTIAAAFKIPALWKDFRNTNTLVNIAHSPFPVGNNLGIINDSSSLFCVKPKQPQESFWPMRLINL